MHIIRNIILASLAVLSCVTANSQLLWRISGNGLVKPSYLFGTHHISPTSIIDSIPGFNDALSSCDVVYGEVSKKELSSIETQSKTLKLATAPADSTLSKVLDKHSWNVLDSLLNESSAGSVRAASLETFTPSFVANQLSLIFALQQFPTYNPLQQLDTIILQKAEEAGKQVKAFETADFQLNLLFGDAISTQATSLERQLRHIDEDKYLIREIANAYAAQDINRLGELITVSSYSTEYSKEEVEQSLKKLIYDRNDAWIETLTEIMPHQSVFVAVGAGHLANEKGLIAQLSKSGYTVTPVK